MDFRDQYNREAGKMYGSKCIRVTLTILCHISGPDSLDSVSGIYRQAAAFCYFHCLKHSYSEMAVEKKRVTIFPFSASQFFRHSVLTNQCVHI